MKRSLLFFAFLFLNFHLVNAQSLQSPKDFLGYELGTRFSRHSDVVSYVKHVAENSEMVNFSTYGKTNEHRDLIYAVISSAENLKNIENIRVNHLKNTGMEAGNFDNALGKAVVWLSYNVHGNEASSTEAAMQTLYELITTRGEWLENTIVILDPSVNPDGRDRYVNWYNQVKAEPYHTSPMAVEHNEPWPGGRPNHYLFDLNRDWAWATQVETRQRLKVYNTWLPHIHVDFHEQGINEPYYFAPAAEPFHEIITPFQRQFQTEIGKNHAEYFDKEGWLYFTKERFDLLYPSYGDTYPTYMGAIGMTYEQAGHGMAGLGIDTREGYELTLVDRVAHHTTTGLSTIEIAAANAGRLNSEFGKFFRNDDQPFKSFVLDGEPDKINALKQLLDRHEISYGNASVGKIRGYNYRNNDNSGLQASQNALLINTNQPKGKMVSVLFEPFTTLSDSLTYDITAWSIPHAYGLDAVASTGPVSAGSPAKQPVINNTPNPDGAGYISKWNSTQDAKFLAALLQEGIKVRFSETAFENNNQKFEPGSLVITKSDNRTTNNFDNKVIRIANDHNRRLTNAGSGFATSGPDFGSPDVKMINTPRIGILRGSGTSSLNYGELWYFFEQELEFPVISIDTDYFSRADLNKLDVLILPSGYYSSVLNGEMDKIKSWVRTGGKVIAIGNAVSQFAGKDNFELAENKPDEAQDTSKKGNLTPYKQRERESVKNLITGSIVKSKVDNTHPMAFGYDDTYFSLKLSDHSFSHLANGYNVVYLEEPEIVSGFAGSEARKRISNSLTHGVEPMGRGSFVYMVDNPVFRAFWENGKLFLVNAIFFVDNDNLSR